MAGQVIISVRDLVMHFPVMSGLILQRHVADVKAVDGVSFEIRAGETLGLVGESGCGKSTLGRTILQLYRATSGQVVYEGEDLCRLSSRQLQPFRRKIQVILQDPQDSLNPRFTAADVVGEPLRIHNAVHGKAYHDRVSELLATVGLALYMADRYPHEFSGGQRQRLGIARALALQPHFIVCDEPISALDVSIQAQIINLLDDLQDKFGMAYLFISHDLSVVRHISDRVAVMYLGKFVELSAQEELYGSPMHPYTQALLSAVPIPDPEVEAHRQVIVLSGEVPSPLNPPPGCVFHPRCPKAFGRCQEEPPAFVDRGNAHFVACHLYD